MAFHLSRVGLCLVLVGSLPLSADVMFHNSHTWRRAKLIVPGQQILSLQSFYQNVSKRFSMDGRSEPLGSGYTRAVTWGQLLQADSVDKANVQAYMNQNNLEPGGVAATANYQVDTEELGFGFNWAYGLTDNWMLGIDIPLTLRKTRVRQRVDMTPIPAQTAVTAKSAAISRTDLQNKVRALAESQLAASGYDQVPEQRKSWDFGDISLLSQVLLRESYHWNWSLQQLVRLPTAQSPRTSDYISSAQGEGAVNLGLATLFDYQTLGWLCGVRGGYVYQLPDRPKVRVPSSDATDSGRIEPKVDRQSGSWWWAAADTETKLSRRVKLALEYSYLMRAKDRYSGETLTAADRARLADGTDQRLHQTRVGFLFRLNPESSRNSVLNKWVASIDYTYPWIGRNANDSARTSLELINYF